MDAGAIFLILALIILVGLFVSRPFFSLQTPVEPQIDTERKAHDLSALLADRDRLLTALQELDFDNTLGKIPAEDYPTQRSELTQSAARVLRALDQAQHQAAASSAEERVEQAVAARRADVVSRPVAADQDDLEQLIASRRTQRQEKSSGFCPKCGKPASKSDKFCSRCGATL